MENFEFQLKQLFICGLGLFLNLGCSHIVSIRDSHFAVPFVSEKQWSGHVALVASSNTNVTLINDVNSNPPRRDSLVFNEVSVGDLFGVNFLSVDGGLHIWRGIEVYIEGSRLGFKQQFLNHGAGEGKWVGALLGSARDGKISTQDNSSFAETRLLTTQAGISLGYRYTHVVPYFSYIFENHEASTIVKNNFGSFGPYLDLANHQYYALGISSVDQGLKYAAEVGIIAIHWDRPLKTVHSSVGLKLGYAW